VPAQTIPRAVFLREARLFCVAALLVHLALAAVGWNRPLLDHYAWRQTQTAITAAYLPVDGYRAAYSTPIFGEPPAAPLEFPFYAAAASLLDRIPGVPLDQAGRALSLLGFLAAAAAAALLMRRFVPVLGPEAPWVALGLLFLSPLYVFYSRAFLIETSALAPSLLFLECLLRATEAHPAFPRRRAFWSAWAFLFGTVAGLAKVTVFLIACVPAAAILVEAILRRGSFSPALLPALATGLALLASFGWVRFTDAAKAANPLAYAVLSSKSLTSWNFGTAAQYLSFSTYRQSFNRALPAVFGMQYTLALFLPLLLALPRLPLRLGLIGLGFVAGPVIFLNLFFVHEYYWAENAVYLLLPLGGLLAYALRKWNTAWVTRLVLLGLALLMLNGWRTHFLPLQSRTDEATLALARAAGEQTPAEGTLLALGFDYDPSIPYYAGRRALMDGGQAATPAFMATWEKTAPRVAAAVVAPGLEKTEETRDRLAAFGFEPQPAFANEAGTLYLREPAKPEEPGPAPAPVSALPAIPVPDQLPPPAAAPAPAASAR